MANQIIWVGDNGCKMSDFLGNHDFHHKKGVLIIHQGEVDLLVPLNSLLTKTDNGDIKYTSDTLPADQGHDAFRDRVVSNPYLESQWQSDEWQFGWDCEEQSNPDLFDHANDKFY